MDSRLYRILAALPRALASTPHVLFLIALGLYLVGLPAAGLTHPSAFAELIGGNYTNVTSDIGACIAAGGTIHLARQHHHRHLEMARALAGLRREISALRGAGPPPSAAAPATAAPPSTPPG